MKNIKLLTLIISLFILNIKSASCQQPIYKDATKHIDLRVKDLLSRMTLEEKFWQLYMMGGNINIAKSSCPHGIFGLQVGAVPKSDNAAGQMLDYSDKTTAAQSVKHINQIQKYFIENTRLGIPFIAFDEALHGLIREGSTVFPQSIALAASWNEPLMREVSSAIAEETKSRGVRDILSPVVNIANDVRWGRTEETYGEDPYLSSVMGVAFVSEFEDIDIITSPKHFVANVADGGRDSYPVYFNERHLREIYLPPFIACFKEGRSRSVMTSYNSLDGTPCTSNSWLLRDFLKKEVGFDGFVISDAGATGGGIVLHYTSKDYAESTKQAIEGGLDVLFQPDYKHYPLFKEAFDKGMIDPAAIDDAVARVLRMKFDIGLFENPYIDEDWADKVNNSPKHREIAKRMARESFVLLKNDEKLLPLKDKKSIALIGYDIKAARLGGYSGPGTDVVSIYDGIINEADKGVKINYAKGVGLSESEFVNVSGEYLTCEFEGKKTNGLNAKYYDNSTFSGTPKVERVDGSIGFGWTLFPPAENIPYDCFSAVWNGKLTSPESGTFNIGIKGDDGYRLYINNKLILDNWKKVSFDTKTVPYKFEKGKPYDIKVEYYETRGNSRLNLIWDQGVNNTSKKDIAEAVNAAKNSDVAVVTVGIHEGEFSDRAHLSLQGKQIDMVKAIAATGKPVIVLIVAGSAVTMEEWKNDVTSIMQIWYPGVEGGNAVAEVLFGKYSPCGKLPITLPIHESQLPLVYNHKPTGRGDDYNNLTGKPLFPFGYGLSYSTFEFSDLTMDKSVIGKNESVKVKCKVKNSGDYEAYEVVQLYIRDLYASVAQPVIQLKGFKKINLKPGETEDVEFLITPEELKILDVNMKWLVEPGTFRIMIGSSSNELPLKSDLEVKQ